MFAETTSTTHASPYPAVDSFYWSAVRKNANDPHGRHAGAHFYFNPPLSMGFAPTASIRLLPAIAPPPPPSPSDGAASMFDERNFKTLLPPFMCHAQCPQDLAKDVHATLLDRWRAASRTDTFLGPIRGTNEERSTYTDCETDLNRHWERDKWAGALFDHERYAFRGSEEPTEYWQDWSGSYSSSRSGMPEVTGTTRWFAFAGEAGTHMNEQWTPRMSNYATSWLKEGYAYAS